MWRRVSRAASSVVRTARRRGAVRDAAETIRRSRGASVVVVYHRVAERATPRYEIVPTVPRELFRRQLEVFGELGLVVPLGELLADPAPEGPPRFALTFDDDLGSHADQVVPVLRDLGLAATFFLSGRALHGLGGYWFERLEAMILERGVAASATAIGVSADSDLALARACEQEPRARAEVERLAPSAPCSLTEDGIRALGAAGATIGFHTLHHEVLPALDDRAARLALTDGRRELEAVVGAPMPWFAYPHGKVDARIAALVRDAGFTDAWTTTPAEPGSDGDRCVRGRWDPLPVSTDHVIIRLGALLASADPSR